MVDKVRDGKEKGIYYGDEVQAHDEAQAEKLLRVELGVLKLKEQELKKMVKEVKGKGFGVGVTEEDDGKSERDQPAVRDGRCFKDNPSSEFAK